MEKITILKRDLPITLLTFSQKVMLAILASEILISKIYFFRHTLQHRDVNFTYTQFVSKGYQRVVLSYTSASNHILYNLFCVVTSHFTRNYELIMSIPGMIAGAILICYSWKLLHRKFGFFVATFATIYSASFFESSRYMVEGRGHLMMTLFSLIATHCIFSTFFQSDKKWYFTGFVLASVAGIYTVPTFIFHLIVLAVITTKYAIVYKNKGILVSLAKALLWIAIGTLLCYLPAISYTGYLLLPHREWHKYYHYFWQKYPVYLAEWAEYMTGIYLVFRKGYLYVTGTGLFGIFLSFWLKFTNEEKKWLLIVPVSLLVFQLITVFIQVFPDNHLFTFFIWYLHIAIAIFLNKVIKQYCQNLTWQFIIELTIIVFILIVGFFQYSFMLHQDLRFVG
jgi:hypothetical protein